MLLDCSDFSKHRFGSAMLDIKVWPPKQSADIEVVVHRLAKNVDGLYVAKVQNNAVNEQGYLADKTDKILIGNDIASIEKVLEPEGWDIHWFPKFFMVVEQLFLFMHQVIYQWTEENGQAIEFVFLPWNLPQKYQL